MVKWPRHCWRGLLRGSRNLERAKMTKQRCVNST